MTQNESEGDQKLEQARTFLRDQDANENRSRAMRALEMENPSIVGKGYPPLPLDIKVPDEIKAVCFDLESSMNRIWNEARWSYVYGFFQGCTFLIGAILELIIEQFLRIRRVWPEYASKTDSAHRSLGTLIKFCKENNLLDKLILTDSYGINGLKIAAVHMQIEKGEAETSPDEHPLVELEDVTVFESTPNGRSIGSGWIHAGQSIIIDFSNPHNPKVKRELLYKPQAADAFRKLSTVFWRIRELEST